MRPIIQDYRYEHEHIKSWSRQIDRSDAFIVVRPEYNYGFPAALKNALDFFYNEWNYKPTGFVSYGAELKAQGQCKCLNR